MALTPNSIITPQTPNVTVGQTIATANTAKDGTGTVVTLYTAGTNGSKLGDLRISYTGTCVASVLRLFLNNGGSTATAGNNSLILSVPIPANTMTAEISTQPDFTVAIGMTIPAGYKLTAALGVTVAAALALCASGGDL